jgi:cephalosporin-C deacetylase-like acetyl esterase
MRFSALTRLLLLLLHSAIVSCSSQTRAADLAEEIRGMESAVLKGDEAKDAAKLLQADARARRDAVNARESEAWTKIRSRADWEKYRDVRLDALRKSLGTFPDPPGKLNVRITGKIDGDGYRIENIVFESRPGWYVTANLYVPAELAKSMPGILICHSHHHPKWEGELQDMGMTWARQGCMVLIMDQLGHGERRQHPFVDDKSFPEKFRPSRQDYYFRFNEGMQLHLIGDSLIGWMGWDLMRGVDLLLARPGIDKERIILLGSVAGGGDPAAVVGALDPRITAVVPFNFGGPQPETKYPLTGKSDASFNFAGGGSWESTRNLRLSARDGFLPWVVVGGIAPRRLVYGHEFSWDQEHDPVWKRLQAIYGFYDAKEGLAAAHGKGLVTGQPPDASHCNNIGAIHRQMIYPALKEWFAMPVPEKEYHQGRTRAELTCLTEEVVKELKPLTLAEIAMKIGKERAQTYKEATTIGQRRDRLQKSWSALLGDIEPKDAIKATEIDTQSVGDVSVCRVKLEVERGIVVPLLMLLPKTKKDARPACVIAVAQEGKAGFLKHRAEEIAALLEGGVAVCLPDLRGTGETRPGEDRGRQSTATAVSSTELMLGQTLVGSRLRDLRSVLSYLRKRNDIDGRHLAVWGDSFASVNADDFRAAVPLDAEKFPELSEPLGGLLALLVNLYELDIQAVLARGTLAGFGSVLQSPFCYLPHDVIVPGAIAIGDLDVLAFSGNVREVRLESLVDGLNRRVGTKRLHEYFPLIHDCEKDPKSPILSEEPRDAAKWLLEVLQKSGS